MEELEKVFGEWCLKNRELYETSEKVIREQLAKVPKQRTRINQDEYPCCVVYDGGNHPEYASNAFSDVICVYIKDDKVYLETEDTDEYSIVNLSASELYEVAYSLYQTINDEYDIEDE